MKTLTWVTVIVAVILWTIVIKQYSQIARPLRVKTEILIEPTRTWEPWVCPAGEKCI